MDFHSLLDNFKVVKEHSWLQQVIIVAVYALFAKGADLFIDRIVRRLASRTRMTVDDYLINFLHGPICWSIFLFGILHALVVTELPKPWQTLLPALVQSVILLIWLIGLVKAFNWLAKYKMASIVSGEKIDSDMFLLFKNVIRVLLFGAALFWLLAIWKVDLTPLFASAGIAGIAVALAAKDTLANFFGGISIFMDKTYKVGDYIIIESGERGEVVEIGIRSTRMKTRDDIMITIPNSILANSKIINESAPVPRFRIRVPVGVAYGTNLDKVEEVLLAVAFANPNVSREPEPRARLRAFGESSVDFELLCWVDEPALKGRAIHNLLKAIYQAFTEQAIVIPFPQRDVHLMNAVNGGD